MTGPADDDPSGTPPRVPAPRPPVGSEHSALVGFMSVPVHRLVPIRRSTLLMVVAFIGFGVLLHLYPPQSSTPVGGGALLKGADGKEYFLPGAVPVSTTTTTRPASTTTTTTTTPKSASTTTQPTVPNSTTTTVQGSTPGSSTTTTTTTRTSTTGPGSSTTTTPVGPSGSTTTTAGSGRGGTTTTP